MLAGNMAYSSMCFHLSMVAVLASDTFHSVTAETSSSLTASRANKLI